MRAMDNAVENGVGQCGIANHFAPAIDRDLRPGLCYVAGAVRAREGGDYFIAFNRRSILHGKPDQPGP
jgi:hypothetical protein